MTVVEWPAIPANHLCKTRHQAGLLHFYGRGPAAYGDIVGQLPAQVTVAARLSDAADMIHMFATEAAILANEFPACRDAIKPDGMVWVSWPKRSSGVATDLTDNVVRETGLRCGLVDIKVCAIDAVWSGLKFLIPKDQRIKRSR